MKKLSLLVSTLESNIPFHETINNNVSKASVGWHLDHSFKVLNAVLLSLIDSKTEEYQWKFNKTRFIVYALGFFPRGKVKAPKSVQSYEAIILNDLKIQLETFKSRISEINALDKNANFNHPIFGVLNLKQTIYFLQLHTKHHLKIIDDILKM